MSTNHTFDVLARHRVIAEFSGIRHIPCRFMTSLCPDRCDHASDVAVFKVINYVEYEKPGQYGDEKQDELYVEIKKPVEFQDASISEEAKKCVEGKKYYVDVDHLYITDEHGSKYPVRPCKRIALAE